MPATQAYKFWVTGLTSAIFLPYCRRSRKKGILPVSRVSTVPNRLHCWKPKNQGTFTELVGIRIGEHNLASGKVREVGKEMARRCWPPLRAADSSWKVRRDCQGTYNGLQCLQCLPSH